MVSRCGDPIRISWSLLQAAELCKQKAALIVQRKKSPADDVRNFFHGTVVDRVMRAWLSEADPTPGAMSGMVEEYIVRSLDEIKNREEGVVRWRSRTDRAELTAYCQELVRRLEPYLVALVLPYEYEPEHRFRVPLRIPYLDGEMVEIELVGGIDILVRLRPDVWMGLDLKATADPYYINKTLGQGIFYDISILASFGVSPIKFVFLQPMVDKRPFVDVVVSDADRRQMLARIKDLAHIRWRGDDEPKASADGCNRCSVKAGCRKFSASEATLFVPVRGGGRGPWVGQGNG